ncbi:hypothetical protein ACFPPD_04225 [Cohnella suwonensis]|uniref:Uncharacterized protein n=1 Tax=Cohnella suwonensis TaxID=696072 RepID=A0ABW0LQ94_9BACL
MRQTNRAIRASPIDYYHPQQVDVIHQIQVVRRHHCVPVYNHVTTVSLKTSIAAISPESAAS